MATGLQPKHFKGSNTSLLSDNLAIIPVKLKSLTSSMLQGIFESAGSQAIGFAGEYLNDPSKPLVLTGLAIATSSQAFVIETLASGSNSNRNGNNATSEGLGNDADSEDEADDNAAVLERHHYKSALCELLLNRERKLLAFNADRLALALYSYLDQRVNNLVDLQSSLPNADKYIRHSPAVYSQLLGGEDNVDKQQLRNLFVNENREERSFHKLAFRAVSAFVAQRYNDVDERILDLPKIDTEVLSPQELNTISKLFNNKSQLEALKPTRVETKVDRQLEVENGTLMAMSSQYKERFRSGALQDIYVKVRNRRYPYKARIESVKGKAVKLRITCQIGDQTLDVVSLVIMGPEDPSLAESLKIEEILRVLQGRSPILNVPLSKSLWFSDAPGRVVPPHPGFLDQFATGMNDKQREALKLMLSESETIQLPIIIGPPGTGKTTVIAAFIRALAASNCPVWVVAHSNVGVKNIASRLIKDDFMDWRLLISKDFYQGWNEDLYKDIPARNRIVSEDFKRSQTRLQLGGARVILCTLNLLVNLKLRLCGFIYEVPLHTLVVDEASQIELGSYFPILARHDNIKKICCFGDDKQLAPFGAEQIPELASVFELPHLRNSAIFLDTQYRVPVAIADFISNEVYDGQLRSRHSSTLRTACRFIDISHGEEEFFGSSYRNLLEVKAVKQLVKAAESKNLDFRVITPYEGQRTVIEAMLRQSGLSYEDRVFNVDSFQGNEADIIIISLVRTKLTGFLSNLRRINVMLTRCKVAMFICCKMSFLLDKAKDTLVGKMAAEWVHEGVPIFDPLQKSVKWESLFNNLKSNTLGKKAAANGTKKVDISKFGYGTALKRMAQPNGAENAKFKSNGRKQVNGRNSRLRNEASKNKSDESSDNDGWGTKNDNLDSWRTGNTNHDGWGSSNGDSGCDTTEVNGGVEWWNAPDEGEGQEEGQEEAADDNGPLNWGDEYDADGW